MIVFGSRGSELALLQTRRVADALRAATGVATRIEVIATRGDRIVDRPLPTIGGKGVFTAELEQALREGSIDAAVHSMKDLPVQDPGGLVLAAVAGRGDAADVLVVDPRQLDRGAGVVPLRAGCRVGTSSHRRRAALERLRPDLAFADIRGNVPTRVERVRRGDYGAVVLAAAGLDRLQLALGGLERVALPVGLCVPAPAQGALAVQCRADDGRVRALLARLHDPVAAACAEAERRVLALLGGGCSMPLGVLVTPRSHGFHLRAGLYTNPGHRAGAADGVFVERTGDDAMALAAAAAAAFDGLLDSPLRGRELVLLRPAGAVADPAPGPGDLCAALRVAGARVAVVSLVAVRPLPPPPVDRELLRDRVLAFTSARAVELFAAAAGGVDLRGVAAFAGGPATAAAAAARGLAVATPPGGTGGAALAAHVLAQGWPARGVLFPCAAGRHPEFEAALAAGGVPVTALPLYCTEPLDGVEVPAGPGTVIVFTSPSSVRAFAARPRPGGARHVAIGPTTAAAMAAAGLRCDAVAAAPTAVALAACCLEPCDA